MLAHREDGLTLSGRPGNAPSVGFAIFWTALCPLADAPHRLRTHALPEERKTDLKA